MKATGPTKLETKKLIAALEKHGRKTKQALWLDIAARIAKPRRNRVAINLWKLDKLAGSIGKNKFMLVPGKVLGSGQLDNKTRVIALEYSRVALEKLKGHGEALTIADALQKKIKQNEIVIVR